jgi:hypothetical protein
MRHVFFSVLRWRFADEAPDHPHKGELHRHAITLALNHIAQRHSDPRRIRLRFAEIAGLSVESFRDWFRSDIDVNISVMAMHDGIPKMFKELVPECSGPEDPGVQLADHLLWQENREGGLDQLGFIRQYENATTRPFTVRHYTQGDISMAASPHRPYPVSLERLKLDEFSTLFAGIERAVHLTARQMPKHLTHLEHLFVPASRAALAKAELSDTVFVDLARAYLVVVDTAPNTPADAACSSAAAAVAARVVAQGDAAIQSVADRWRDYRAALVAANRADFLFGNDLKSESIPERR